MNPDSDIFVLKFVISFPRSQALFGNACIDALRLVIQSIAQKHSQWGIENEKLLFSFVIHHLKFIINTLLSESGLAELKD